MRVKPNSGDIIGNFGLVFIETEPSLKPYIKAHFKCTCGATFISALRDVKSDHTKSCGCLSRKVLIKRNTTHGMSRTKLNKVWVSMRQRCNDPNAQSYNNYGGRGITVCSEWQDFLSFKAWADSSGYAQGLTLERVDVNGNYEPDNCTWEKRTVQSQNRRINSNNTSGYKGVSYEKSQKKYSSKIMWNGVKYFLGWFKSPVEAATAYNEFILMNDTKHTLNKIEEELCA